MGSAATAKVAFVGHVFPKPISMSIVLSWEEGMTRYPYSTMSLDSAYGPKIAGVSVGKGAARVS